jgi:hypothetical protein
MAKVIKAGDCEIEAGFIVQDGAFRATAVVRTKAVDRRDRPERGQGSRCADR